MATGRVAIVLLAGSLVLAQPQAVPTFEVASVKIAPPRMGTERYIAMDSDPAMIRYSNVNLKILIAIAYSFDSDRILGGPGWLDSQAYDVAAKIPAGVSKDKVPAMLQALLADRFKLAVHRESKDQRVYFLVVGEGGLKAKEAQEADSQEVQQVRGEHMPLQIVRGGIMGRSITTGALAGALARVAGNPVIDRTGLTKQLDIDLKWTPEDDSGDAPYLFAAIQKQLGLKLEPGRAPIEVLVVEHAERAPADQ
jgi:uncharacterized protein (TIGR03435 family)